MPKPARKPSPPGRGQGEGGAQSRRAETLTPALSRGERETDGPPGFDEAAYLAGYPDVADAVKSGAFASGRDHFLQFGRAEGRSPRPLNRRARLLDGLDLTRLRGAEIGPLDRPLVRKGQGDILYIDHTDRAALREIFRKTEIDLDAIVDVDAIWGESRLLECLPGQRPVDYIIASHVVEHVPDLLGWLQEVREALTPHGELRLAVPDRRYTFDILRPESRLADVLDAYARRARAPLPRAVIEFLLLTRTVDARQAWLGQIDLAALRAQTPPLQDALNLAGEVLQGRYVDSHCWIVTPRSFAELMEQLAAAGLLGMACGSFHDTAQFDLEFLVALRPCDDPAEAAASWRVMRDGAAG